jgi:hypothetical protein
MMLTWLRYAGDFAALWLFNARRKALALLEKLTAVHCAA